MPLSEKIELYAVVVHLSSGASVEGYVQKGGEIEGLWLVISRTPDLNNATYINRDKVTYFELAEIK